MGALPSFWPFSFLRVPLGWTPEQADNVIASLERAVVEFLSREVALGSRRPPYSAVWHALRTALIMHPSDTRAEVWRWKLLYYLALDSEGQVAVELYSRLIRTRRSENGLCGFSG